MKYHKRSHEAHKITNNFHHLDDQKFYYFWRAGIGYDTSGALGKRFHLKGTVFHGLESAIEQNISDNEGFSIDFESCVNNKNIEDFVLNDRIEGAKNFKVNATPTIIINNEKFEKKLNYKNLKKALEKMI